MEKRKMLKRLLKNRKGTAEVIGSVLFIVILLFFFTNVYLWHDAATKQVNDLYVKKMNAGMEVNFDPVLPSDITAKGSAVVLSRIWIVTTGNEHLYADLTSLDIHLVAGRSIPITFVPGTPAGGSINVDGNAEGITLHYSQNQITRLSVINTLGVIV
jgi:hypothetical protein